MFRCSVLDINIIPRSHFIHEFEVPFMIRYMITVGKKEMLAYFLEIAPLDNKLQKTFDCTEMILI